MIPVSGVVPICGHRVAPPDMLEVFRSSTHRCRGEGPASLQPHGPKGPASIYKKAIEGCATRTSRVRAEPTWRVIPSPSAHSMTSGQPESTTFVTRGFRPRSRVKLSSSASAFLAGHFGGGHSCGTAGRNTGSAPFGAEQQHQRSNHESGVDRHASTEQPQSRVEPDRSKQAELRPPSTAEDQHPDDRLERYKQTDKQ